MKKLIVVPMIFLTTLAFGACETGYMPTLESSTTLKYIHCDTEAELPSSGFNAGDLIYAEDTSKLYVAVDATTYTTIGLRPTADDQVRLSTSPTASAWVDVADCDDTGGNHLNYDTGTNTFTCGTTGPAGSGEANTASNSGTGNRLVLTKSGVDLPFRTLISGDNVTMVTNATDITIGVVSVQSNDVTGVVAIDNGGTGAISHTDGGILIGKGTSPFLNTGVLAKGTLIVGDGETDPTTLATGTNGFVLSADSSTASGLVWAANPNQMPKGHIYGLVMSNAADTANDITIAAGEARSDDGLTDMILPAAITKQMDASWAVGSAAGGMNTGAEANSTWYEVHLIKRVDTGVVDVMFTTTANRATLPTSYTKKRRIGWVRNDGAGALLQFTQIDNHVTLTTQVNDSSTACSATAAAVTVTAPPSSRVRFRAAIESTTSVNSNTGMVFSEIVEGNVTPALTTGILSLGQWDLATGASATTMELRVSATSTIEFDCAVATGTFDVSTFGWIDDRGAWDNN